MGLHHRVGLLLDTFIVRTITVPAVAVLIGDKNWWPSKTPREMLEAAQRWAKVRASDDSRRRGHRSIPAPGLIPTPT